jgi:hypothetical protein
MLDDDDIGLVIAVIFMVAELLVPELTALAYAGAIHT